MAIATLRPFPATTTESPLTLTPTLVVIPLEEMTSARPGLSSGVVVVPLSMGAAVGVTGDEDGEVIEEKVGSSELAATVNV